MYIALVELLHSSNVLGITCDHKLEVIRAGEVSGTSRMGCMVEPAHVHTEKPYNPCGYRVSSYVARKQRRKCLLCGVDITHCLAGHYCLR